MKTLKTLILAFIGILLLSSCFGNVNPALLVQVGEKVPDFTLTTTDGTEYTPETLMSSGTPFAIMVTKPGCGYCKQRLLQVKNTAPENYPILVLSIGEKEETMAEFEEYGITFPVVAPAPQDLTRRFTQISYPVLFIFNKNGICQSRIRTEQVTDENLIKYLSGTPFPE